MVALIRLLPWFSSTNPFPAGLFFGIKIYRCLSKNNYMSDTSDLPDLSGLLGASDAPRPSEGKFGLARLPVRWQAAALLVGSALLAALLFSLWRRPDHPRAPELVPAAPPSAPAPAPEPSFMIVHVTGAVAAPGLVSLPEGSRAADAVAAAGGVRSGGRLGNINLAAPVTDGMHLAVPWADSGPAGAALSSGSGGGGYPIDVNRAGAEELTGLPGVGEVLAARIAAHREARGPFRTLEDLLDVPGIGEGKLAGLRDYAAVRP